MRTQISFEVMVYFAIAGIALLFSLTALISEWHGITNAVDSYSLYAFSGEISKNMENRIYAFRIYVPVGACNATFHDNLMSTEYGTFYFPAMARAANSVFCPDGKYSNLTVAYSNGTWVIG